MHEFMHRRPTTPMQRKTLENLSLCRTEDLGGFVLQCDSCDYRRVVYNPCRDRHCPSCEGQAAADWLQGLRQRILPCRYFHVVFTLPAELRWIAYQNAAVVYGLLLRCAGETLLEVTRDQRFLGGQVGVTAVLHTWRSDLKLHPHVHCLVTAGGLDASGERWLDSWGSRYLAPTKLLAARFRKKFLRRLAQAYARGELQFVSNCAQFTDPQTFGTLQAKLQQRPWLVYARSAFRDLEHLLRYLARYTHRVAISDRRLLDVGEGWVIFATKGEEVEVDVFEFIRRFLLHVLPHGFVKIRHYGLFASASRTRLEQARALLQDEGEPELPSLTDPETTPEFQPCPICLFGTLERHELPEPQT